MSDVMFNEKISDTANSCNDNMCWFSSALLRIDFFFLLSCLLYFCPLTSLNLCNLNAVNIFVCTISKKKKLKPSKLQKYLN